MLTDIMSNHELRARLKIPLKRISASLWGRRRRLFGSKRKPKASLCPFLSLWGRRRRLSDVEGFRMTPCPEFAGIPMNPYDSLAYAPFPHTPQGKRPGGILSETPKNLVRKLPLRPFRPGIEGTQTTSTWTKGIRR
jgi:hypothetical protein